MPLKAVVFGGSGFLGSHVADALSLAGYEVSIFDIKESFYKQPHQNFIQGDILNQEDVQSAINGMDFVFHLAGIADIDECYKRPVDTIKYNVLGTSYILEACCQAQIKKIVFASSAYVYSNSGSFYRVSKQACENLVEAYHEKCGLDYVILRYGSLYGPRSDRRNSLFRICEDALRNHEIVYHGTGQEKREYIHVLDAAKMSVDVLKEEFLNSHIILTGTSSMQYSELLEMVQEMLKYKIKVLKKENKSKTHYSQSPYAFSPKLGRKLTNNTQIDLGQGLLELINEIYKSLDEDTQRRFEGALNLK